MFRKFFRRVKSQHFPVIFVSTGTLFILVAGVLYRLQVTMGQNVSTLLLILFLSVLLIWSILGVVSVNVGKRDGFLDGYDKGYQKGKEDSLKEAVKGIKELQR